MVHFCIVDDDDIYCNRMMEYLEKLEQEFFQKGSPCGKFQVTRYKDGSEIVNNYSSNYDIILMDIEMGSMNGMTAAEKIREIDKDVVIIFITNLAQYAIKGYEVEALDYILKPISYYPFAKKIERALGRKTYRDNKVLSITVGKGNYKKIKIEDLLYIEALGHTIIYHLTNEDVTTSGTIKELEEKLDPKQFFRCNKGYLVNLDKVENIDGFTAFFGNQSIQISRSKKKAFIDALNDYMSETAK